MSSAALTDNKEASEKAAAPQASAMPQAPAAPKKNNRSRIIAIVAGVAVGIGAFVYLSHRGKESTDDAFIEGHIVQISPKIAERVDKVLVDDNAIVKAGDPLVELDPLDNMALVAQAEANLASSQAKLIQAQAQLKSAEAGFEQARADIQQEQASSENSDKELTRSTDLRKSGAIAQREYDTALMEQQSARASLVSKQKKALAAESDVKVANAAVQSAQAMVRQAEALMQTAKLRISYTHITAPQSGRVTRKNVEPGNYVQAGSPLMAIVSNDVWVVANFKETQLDEMRPGQRVDIRVDAYPDLQVTGHVDSIQSGTGSRFSLLPSENATGNYVKVVQRVPVKIVLDPLPQGSPILGPGMSVIPTVHVN